MAYEIAVPEENTAGFQDYVDALRRRGGTALKLAAALFVLGLVAIFFWPNTYRSTATILIEDPDIPPGLVPTTVTTFAARQIQYINQRVMTRTNLSQIIEKFNLFAAERKYLPTLLLVDDVQQNVKIDIIDAPVQQGAGMQANTTIAFTVGFEHSDPNTARQVANELVSLYLAENVRARTEQTAQTSQFMQAEVDRLDAEMRDTESQMAKIMQDNKGALPEETGFNLQVLQRADTDLIELDRQIKGIEQARIMLDAQLAQIEPMSTMTTPDGRTVSPPADQLRGLENQLAVLEGRYSPDHPDVVRTRRDVEALRAEIGGELDPKDLESRINDAQARLAIARERYTAEHPEVVQLERDIKSMEERQAKAAARPAGTPRLKQEPNNPAYIQVQAQRKALDSQAEGLRDARAKVQAKMAEYEKNMSQTSDVQRQLSALSRRMGTATANYQSARDRLFAAQMGQAMETQSKGERFTMVEPPDVPLQPSSPNRPVLLALLLILVLATGFGWPQVAESMDSSINSGRAIERVQGSPPLAEIPLIQNTMDVSRKRKLRLSVLVVAPVVLAIGAVAVHFFLINLDVLWYVALRRLGM